MATPAPAVDHAADVKKYAPKADDAKIKSIIKYIGIGMKTNDGQMVACSSKEELERVRDGWMKKKLAMTGTDAELDKAIKSVCDTMKGDKNKSRVAFYYLLADKGGKLGAV
jgi:Protein of unknown function (DUF2853)